MHDLVYDAYDYCCIEPLRIFSTIHKTLILPPQFQLDRFIPNRSAMDFDFARSMLTGAAAKIESAEPSSPTKQLYRQHLAEILNINRTRILAFKNKAPPSSKNNNPSFSPIHHRKSIKQKSRRINKVSSKASHLRSNNM